MKAYIDASAREILKSFAWQLLKLEISLSFDKKYFGIIQGFQRQRSMIYYLQVDDDLLTFSYFHFLYI